MHANSVLHQTEKHSKSWNFWGDIYFTNFSKITFFRKKWDRFWKSCKVSSWDLNMRLFLTWTTRLYPREQVQSILQPQISVLFAHFQFECKKLNFKSMTRYSWKQNHSRKCYQMPLLMFQKNSKLWNYRTGRCTKKCTHLVWRFHIAGNIVRFRTLHATFDPLCRFHFWSDCHGNF